MATETWSVRLSTVEREQIERLARLERTTMKEAVLAAVHHCLADVEPTDASSAGTPPSEAPAGSVLERLEEAGVVGLFDGPEDLSTNKAYLEGLGDRRSASPESSG